MPVIVTHAESAAGHATVRTLRLRGGEVRVWLDADSSSEDDAAAFRRLGCKVAVGTMDDEGRMEMAFEQGHTVVHLGRGPLEEPEDTLEEAASVLSAAISAGCRRFIWPSHLGANDPRGNPYLRACADVEELLAEAPLETVVLRRALTYGPSDPLTAVLVTGIAIEELGARADARHEPLFLDDLAGAIVTADAMERRPAGAGSGDLHIAVELVGPDVVQLGDLVRVLGGPVGADPRWSRRARKASAGLARDAAAQPVPDHLIDLLSRDLLGGEEALGRGGTPLAVGAAAL